MILLARQATSLPLNNLATTNDGYYSVIVSNSLGAVTSSVAKLTVVPRFGDLVVYDPFDYTPGSTLNNVGGWSITSAAENGAIEAGNLSIPGLRESVGNRYTLTGNTSMRKPFGEYTNGTVYFSFAFRLDDPGTSTGSETVAGLSFGTSTAFPHKNQPDRQRIGVLPAWPLQTWRDSIRQRRHKSHFHQRVIPCSSWADSGSWMATPTI